MPCGFQKKSVSTVVENMDAMAGQVTRMAQKSRNLANVFAENEKSLAVVTENIDKVAQRSESLQEINAGICANRRADKPFGDERGNRGCARGGDGRGV